jgi:hypothetical protein
VRERPAEAEPSDPFRRSLPALVAREGWFDNLRFKVIRPHLPFSIPVHEDRGTMHVDRRGMRFEGEEFLHFEIAFHDIVDVHLGFDERYKRRFEQAFGLFGKPLRITYQSSGEREDIYLYLGFRFTGRRSENSAWYDWFETMRPG